MNVRFRWIGLDGGVRVRKKSGRCCDVYQWKEYEDRIERIVENDKIKLGRELEFARLSRNRTNETPGLQELYVKLAGCDGKL